MQLTSSFVGRGFQTSWAAPKAAPSTNATRQVTCMAKKKGIRCIVTLECTEARGEGGTPSRYVTQKVLSSLLLRMVHCSGQSIDRHWKTLHELNLHVLSCSFALEHNHFLGNQ